MQRKICSQKGDWQWQTSGGLKKINQQRKLRKWLLPKNLEERSNPETNLADSFYLRIWKALVTFPVVLLRSFKSKSQTTMGWSTGAFEGSVSEGKGTKDYSLKSKVNREGGGRRAKV